MASARLNRDDCTDAGEAVSDCKLLLLERKRPWRRSDDRRYLGGDVLQRSLDQADRLPRNLRVNIHNIGFAVLSGLLYMADVCSDLVVSLTLFHQCQFVIGGLTMAFAFVPAFLTNTVGYLWAIDDLTNLPVNRVTNRFKKSVWIWGLMTQSVVALFSFEAAYFNWSFRRLLAADNGIVGARTLELYYWILESDRDATILRVLIAFLESAPQLLLQAYSLCKFVLLIDSPAPVSFYACVHYVSLVSSLFGLAWSLMSQQRCLRYVRQDKENLGYSQCLWVLCWRTLTVCGRLMTLLMMLFTFEYLSILVIVTHYLLVLCILLFYEKPMISADRTQRRLILLGVAWVHIFCPWNVAEGRTRYRYLWRYGLELVELLVVALCMRLMSAKHKFPVKDECILAASCCYAFGLIIMCVYYRFFHPNLSKCRSTQRPPLVIVYTPPEKLLMECMAESTALSVGTTENNDAVAEANQHSIAEDK